MIPTSPLRVTPPVLAVLCVAALTLPGLAEPAPAPAGSAQLAGDGRLIILGFDGADGRTIEEMMDRGELPHLARLRDQGTFSKLGTSAPAESPVSWACLNSGQNPAKTGVPGFVMNRGHQTGGPPMPGFGHLVQRSGSDAVPIEELDDLPIPAWSPGALAGVGFAAVFLAFLVVFAALLRVRAVTAIVLSALLGSVGGWGGWKLRGYLPAHVPRWENPNVARNLWDFAADQGVKSIVIDAAQTFDQPETPGARVLAGLGVPDARAGIGDWFIYTTDDLEFQQEPEGRDTSTAGTVFRVYDRDGRIESHLYGPTNFWREDQLRTELDGVEEQLASPTLGYKESIELNGRRDDLKAEIKVASKERVNVPLDVELKAGTAVVSIDGHAQELAPGDWSDWYRVSFDLNPLIKARALTRVKLIQLEPTFELYVNVLDIDPEHPPFWQPISTPHDFSAELASSGLYETYGWACMTMPFKDGEISPETMLEDIEFTMKWRERLTYEALQRDDWKLLMSVFSTTDRVQHMTYQYYDEGHPLYDADAAEREMTFFGDTITLAEAIPAIYRQMDRIVGTVMDQHLGPDDVLMVCSDHGFQSARHQVSLNNWLVENGYMKLVDNPTTSKTLGGFVDWSQTRAYAMGLGFIYVNLEGREPEGIVPPGEKDALLAEIREKLLASVDPETGLHTVLDTYLPAEIHPGGKFLDREGDMIVGVAPTYRVAWATTGGGIKLVKDEDGNRVPGPIYYDNDSPWSGGHVSVHLPDVAGVFFCNRDVDLPEGGPNLLHVAPTALKLLGVDVPAVMDLQALDVH